MKNNELNFERANELLRYDPESGKLTWRVNRGPAKACREAGCDLHVKRQTYRVIGIDGTLYLAHRVAWLLYYGEWPENEIDHIDGGGTNNCIKNLRDVTGTINSRNRRMQNNNTSGICGVTWNNAVGKWQAQVGLGGKNNMLGYFSDIDKAAIAVREFRAKHGFTGRHGIAV